MGLKKCCVCYNLRKDAIFHRFPRNEEKLKKWLKCLNREDLNIKSAKLLTEYYVCQSHFEKKFITAKSRLTVDAYPTLFSNEEILAGTPSSDKTRSLALFNPLSEHCYFRKRHFDHTYCRPSSINESIATGSDNIQSIPGTSKTVNALEIGNVEDVPQKINEDIEIPVTDKPVIIKNSKPRKKRQLKKRIANKIKDLPTSCQIIYNEYCKARRQLNFHKRAEAAIDFREKKFPKLKRNLNPHGRKILEMQMRLCNKSKASYRFTHDEKIISLSILKQSPKCYRFLSKIFILPSRATLNRMVAKLKIHSGISLQLFDLLKEKVSEWDHRRQLCSIIFDEMSLEPGLYYDKHNDKINGFVELNEKEKEYADHALVFMLRGAVHKWHQPIAFYFSKGAASAVAIKWILKEIIDKVIDCGFQPLAIICDQGTTFQSALKSMKEETKRAQILSGDQADGTIIINGLKLHIVFDPPHLIKGLRNNFLNKDISLDGKISRWDDIIDVYKTDNSAGDNRMLHKLNDEYVIPHKIKKMKVRNCVKVFSNSVSAALKFASRFSHYIDGRPVSKTMENTSEIVLFFDKLFDSMNGNSNVIKTSKCLRSAVTQNSPHHIFWKNALKTLKKIKYITKEGTVKSVPSLCNCIVTIESLLKLWIVFKEKGLLIMRPRFFNSDPIENFFGQVRAYNYRNNDPTCHSFMCTFKSLLITRIINFHNGTFNCKDDPADQVLNFKTFFDESGQTQPGVTLPHQNDIEVVVEQARRERLSIHSRAYTAGWVVKKILKINNNCNICKEVITTKEISNIHAWISHKEYTQVKSHLNYPSENVVRCFGTIVNKSNEYLENSPNEDKISAKIIEIILSEYSFDFFNCPKHQNLRHLFVVLVVQFTITNWCSNINRILKGTDIIRLERRNLPAMQKKALEKFKKKIVHKRLNK